MDEKKKKVVLIDGGLGRVLTSIPAVEKLAENNDVIVITSWVEPYMFNEKIERVYHVTHPYLFEDVIYDNELIHPEPYTYSGYYKDKVHLMQAFDILINGKEGSFDELQDVHLFLSDEEEKFGKDFLDQMKKQFKKEKVIIFQPFGQGAVKDGDIIKDASNRSLPESVAREFVKELSKEYGVLLFGNLPIDMPELIVPLVGPNQMPNDRQWFAIIKQCDAILAIDSSLQHIAYAWKKPGVVMLGATYETNVTYPKHFKIFKRDGFPKMYDPIRIPAMNLTTTAAKKNQGALLFSDREIALIINTVKGLI